MFHKSKGIIVSFIILSIIISIIVPGFASAQINDEWKKTYGGAGDERAKSVLYTDDGGLIIAGHSRSFGPGKLSNFHIIKTNKNGFTEWRKTYGGRYDDEAEKIIKTDDGGYLIAGSSESFRGRAQYDFWMVKIDSKGEKQWDSGFGGNYNEKCYSVLQTEDGGYLLGGSTITYGDRGADYWVVKTDEEGNKSWSETYGGAGDDICRSVIKTEDGNYTLAGYTDSFGDPGQGAYLVKINEDGNEIWNRTAGGTFDDYVYDAMQVDDGGYVYVGSTTSYGAGEESFWMVKTDSQGFEEWNYSTDGDYNEIAYAVDESEADTYVMTGYTSSYGQGGKDLWVVEIDQDGEAVAKQTFGSAGDETAYAIAVSGDDKFALAGSTDSFGAGGEDYWVVQTRRQRQVPLKWAAVGVVAIIALIVVGNMLNKRYRFW
ncbi:MAG: hypothetical protein V5A66_03150 [Candidatus Thermoplasmatota archaeon]